MEILQNIVKHILSHSFYALIMYRSSCYNRVCGNAILVKHEPGHFNIFSIIICPHSSREVEDVDTMLEYSNTVAASLLSEHLRNTIKSNQIYLPITKIKKIT